MKSLLSSPRCVCLDQRFSVKQAFVYCPWAFQDQPLGNWRMKRQVDSEDEVIYKFSPKFVLKAGQSVTVSNVN